ncbi:serine/threonine receptor-like kinase NFP [Salvia miltiorrhiza]|uniref:serine/threonine receptor-like kinase NFP n=1 Tax=Salvia miltiorrhiza TaxID=226208 RepID=UPI0025AD4D2A|nr:serine/threonine receptor-like kinase NFP [Salvia miltiorrhiza]
MAPSLNTLLILSSLLVISAAVAAAQSPNFTCSSDSPTTCPTYVTYRVRSPYTALGTISRLFGITGDGIAAASNLSSGDAPLIPDQLLMVPVNCTCNGTHYFSNKTYHMNKDDSFYTVSTKPFQNLTNIYVVEDMNPSLDPSNLTVGVEVVFPLLCKCPGSSFGSQYLITYVWQPGDDVLSVANMFQASSSDIVVINNDRNFSAATCLPVLIPVNSLVILQSFVSSVASSKSRPHRMLVAVLSIVMVLLVVSSGLAVYFRLLYKRSKVLARSSSSLETFGLIPASKDQASEPKTSQDKLLPGVSGYLCNPIIYDLDVIMKATSNLSERCAIGRSVYKAIINGDEVVVKKTREAAEEIQILQRVSHGNLVGLMGVSLDDDLNFYVVYEYVENGSLDNWLFPKVSPSSHSVTAEPLSWKQRLVIALDVANGLQYMHEHAQPSVVHRDISTSNILLDSKFKAKISNFSAARPAACSLMLNVDVFCFGVVVLELLSGRKVMETKDNGKVVMLWVEIGGILEGGDQRKERLRRWMDPKLKGCFSIDDALSLATIAKLCTSEKASERPTMAEVVFSLSVVVQPSPFMYDKSWISKFEAEEVGKFKLKVLDGY